MATTVTYVGNQYSVPAYNDTGYAQGSGNLSSYLIALATGSLTLSGGTFTLTADANFGSNFGLVALYYKSVTANIAQSGVLRLANSDSVVWRNAANSGDLALSVNGSNQLTFNSSVLATLSGGVVPVAQGGTNSSTALANSKVMVSSGGKIVEASGLSYSGSDLTNGNAGSGFVVTTPDGSKTFRIYVDNNGELNTLELT